MPELSLGTHAALVVALILTIIFSFVPERFIKPAIPRLTLKSVVLQGLLVSILFLCVSLVVQRAVFSALAVSVFLIILSGVSNAKFIALREPMVFSDFMMFSQAFKHPRLYFPFLGLLPVILMPIIIIALIYTVLKLEPALATTPTRIITSIAAILAAYLIAKKFALTLDLTQDPATDIASHGLLNSLFAYLMQARTHRHQDQIKTTLNQSVFAVDSSNNTIKKTPPHISGIFHNITVIQSESFFDARLLHPSIKTAVLENYDVCKTESIQFGKLNVPAWGANTMRTEFSFLTGLKYEDMGFYRYYPYQFLHRMPITSLASHLKSQGYFCVCIHPHPASFFGREKIFPNLGFDAFIDIQSFNKNDTFGPYISDQAVTEKIFEVTQENTDKPLFIFAITMENHGPLYLEKTTLDEQKGYFQEPGKRDLNDLTVYLRHLKNADKMVAELTSAFRQFDKPNTLCFYGDHIPSMPKTYQQLDYNDEASDYFIWHNAEPTNKPNEKELAVDSLAKTLLNFTGNLTFK